MKTIKTRKRSVTLNSFLPFTVLLATPLLFSTLSPAPIDSSTWNVPQSQLVLEKFLKEQDIKNGEIEEVRFLDYGEIETAYILQNPKFQRQVDEVSAQASQAGAPMPPLLTLVALFAFAMATGSATLKEFFKFSTYTEKVKKTVQVTKKVARTVYRKVTEKVARTVKTVKQVAYTAYETVKNVAYNTRTWVTEAVRHRPVTWHPVEQMEIKSKFLLENIRKYAGTGNFTRNYERNLRYLMPPSNLNALKKEYDDVSSGRKVGRYAQRVRENVFNHGRTVDHLAGQFLDGIADPKLREKLLKEYKSLNDITYIERTTHSETTPIVTYTQKAFTEYRDEVETKTVYDTVTREVPETIYENVTEDREITEDVTKYSFTPLNEKIDIAMGYLKNYSQTLKTPSNRNFSDDVLTPNKNLPLFAGAVAVYNNLQAELKTANIYNYERTNPGALKAILKRHNEFIYSMKAILTKVQKGQTPEEQMTILFGKTYADSVKTIEKQIAEIETQERAISARFEEIYQLRKANKISEGYYRSLYSSAKQNRDQIYRRKRDTEKYLKKSKEEFSHRFNSTVSSLQNLTFLRNLDDWRSTLEYGERAVASRLVPFTTANGSVIYRKLATITTTQAQPKKTIPQNLQTAGFLDLIKKLLGKDTTEISATTQAQTKQFLEYDRAKVQQTLERHSWKHSYSEEFYLTKDGLQVQKVQAPNLGKYFGSDTVGTIEPKALILHRTGGSSGLGLAKSWADFSPSKSKKYMPATHYLIDENGEVVKFADDTTRLFHVGKNKHGSSNKEKVAQIENENAIGIEIVGLPQMVNGKLEYVEPSLKQLDSLLLLVKDILKRNELTKNDIFAHPEVSAKNPTEGIHAKNYILKMLDNAN